MWKHDWLVVRSATASREPIPVIAKPEKEKYAWKIVTNKK